MVLAQGQRVQSYTLLDPVGDPNMGQVWLAKSGSGATVVLKCISEQFRGNDEMIRRFWREAAFQMRLRHQNIVPVSDCVQHDGDLFLVMRYIRGGSLEDRLRHLLGNPLPLDEVLSISSDVLNALDYAHQQGVIHRDVKPSNILLEEGRAYLTDFGVAMGMKRRHRNSSLSAGTYPYMSPEQILLDRPTDQRSDVYGFGCVLYEMLTGRPPFPPDPSSACTDEQLRQMHVHLAPVAPNQLNVSISERLNHVTLTALSKQPADRFPGCGSFALAIAGAAPPKPQSAPIAIEQVSRAANFGLLFVVWAVGLLISGAAKDRADITVIVLLVFSASAAIVLRLLSIGWAAIEDAQTRRRIFPWIAIPAFAAEYNAFVDRNRLNVRHESPVVYVLFIAGAAAVLLLSFSRVFVFCILIESLVLVPLMVYALTSAINRLATAQRSAL